MPASAGAGPQQLADWRRQGRWVEVGGRRLFVRTGGSGAAVLLLHGYPTGSFDWFALWPLLVPDHHLVAPDLLGLGFSDKPVLDEYPLALHAALVDELLVALGLSSVHVVAHDLGVRVAQEMLARRAEPGPRRPRIDSLVLLNGAMCPEAYRPRFIQRLLATPLGDWIGPRLPRSAFDRAIASLFGPGQAPEPGLLDAFWALVNEGDGLRVAHRVGRFWLPRQAQRDRLVGALLAAQVPLRVVNGSADPNSGRHMADRLLELAPGIAVERLDGVGHWPQIEVPERVAAAVQATVRSPTRAATLPGTG